MCVKIDKDIVKIKQRLLAVKNMTRIAIKTLQGSAVMQKVLGVFITYRLFANIAVVYVCQKLWRSVNTRPDSVHSDWRFIIH